MMLSFDRHLEDKIVKELTEVPDIVSVKLIDLHNPKNSSFISLSFYCSIFVCFCAKSLRHSSAQKQEFDQCRCLFSRTKSAS